MCTNTYLINPSKGNLASIKGGLLAVLFFVWTSSYLWGSFELGWISRFTEIIWLIVSLWMLRTNKCLRTTLRRNIWWLLYLAALLVVWFPRDVQYPYALRLYFKTGFYVLLGFLIGSVVGISLVANTRLRDTFVNVLSITVMIFIVVFFVLARRSGWTPRELLLSTGLAQYYQGMSRLIGVSFIILLVLRKYAFALLSFPVVILVVFAFRGGGGIIAILLAFFWFLVLLLREHQGKYLGKRVGWMALFSLGSYFLIVSYRAIFLSSYTHLVAKFTASGQTQTRLWLMKEGVNLWLSSIKNFIFGPTVLTYACHVGYCESYRHPHNIVILLLVWFGVFSFPLFVPLYIICKDAFSYFLSLIGRYVYLDFAFALFLYYLVLSLIGGDIEQNRHLFSSAAMAYTMYRGIMLKHLCPQKKTTKRR